MKVKTVSFERLKTDPGTYNNQKIGLVVEVEEKDDPEVVLQQLKKMVDNAFDRNERIDELKNRLVHLNQSLKSTERRIDRYIDDKDEYEELKKVHEETSNQIKETEDEINKLEFKIDY